MILKEILLLTCALISYSSCSSIIRSSKLTPLKPSEDYTNVLAADDDDPEQYTVFWRYDAEEIHFEIHCKSKGWVGLGMSPSNAGMKGADIAIAWVDKAGKGHIQDCYATDNARPMIDAHQDLVLIDAAKVSDYTIVKFKRKLATCDKDDREIKSGTFYLIFAWNDETPGIGERDWAYHGENRFIRTTFLINYREENIEQQATLPSDYFFHDIRMQNITIAAKETYYFCDLFELPAFTEEVHLIQYEMIFGPNSKKFVHHLLGFECGDDYAPSEPLKRECGAVPLPSEFTTCMTKMILAWGIGGNKNYQFPPEAGYLLKPSAKPRYLLLEMHYDNPRAVSDVIDNTGIRLYFTKQLRKHHLGIISLGTGFLNIPPRSEATKFSSICYPECTERFFPDDGITVVTGLLHTHLAGKAVKTTLVRNGKEIKDIFNNPTYDFEYQNALSIEPLKIMKGDALITECIYGTRNRTKFTAYGFGTYEEMCINFVYYYPRIPEFTACQTQMPTQIMMNFYRSLIKDGLVSGLVLSDDDTTFWQNIQYIQNYFKDNVTFTPVLTKKFEDLFGAETQNRTLYCGNFVYPDKEIYKENIQDYAVTEHYVEPDKCDIATPAPVIITPEGNSGSGSNAISLSISIVSSMILYNLFKTL